MTRCTRPVPPLKRVVPGGGVALIRAQPALETLAGANEDQNAGIKILARSIEEPLRQMPGHRSAAPRELDSAPSIVGERRRHYGTWNA
jgi:hypothetical protein